MPAPAAFVSANNRTHPGSLLGTVYTNIVRALGCVGAVTNGFGRAIAAVRHLDVFRSQQHVRNHHDREQPDGDGHNHDQTAISPHCTALNGQINEVVMPGCQHRKRSSQSHHRHAQWQRHAGASDRCLRGEPHRNFAQPQPEFGDDKTESDNRDTRPDPCQKCPLVGEILRRLSVFR